MAAVLNDMSRGQREIVKAVTEALHVTWPDLTARTRGPREVSDARRVLIALLHRDLGMGYSQIGRFVGRTPQDVRHSVNAFYRDRTEAQDRAYGRVMDQLVPAPPRPTG